MPARAPEAMLAAFKNEGYKIVDEGKYNWLVALDDEDEPFVIPKQGEYIGFFLQEKADWMLRATAAKKAGLPVPPMPEASMKNVAIDDDLD